MHPGLRPRCRAGGVRGWRRRGRPEPEILRDAARQPVRSRRRAEEPGRMTAAPWYRRTLRWAQTNLTEKDPARYDVEWWRAHWRRTRVQGAIINAGGIVAYYPSKFPLQHRAEFLGDRDLYGEIVEAARA